MTKSSKFLAVSLIAVLLSALAPLQFASAADTLQPFILKIDQTGANVAQPLVLGLSAPNTEVLIYLDGEFNGLANVNKEKTGTDNFYYQPAQAWPAGVHTVSAVARDLDSLVLSIMTEPIELEIKPLPAPTLIVPNENTVTGQVKPFITGLTRSGTKVMIFIDGVLNGTTASLAHESGTANFAYRPFLNLNVGTHQAYAIAKDENGVRSARSDVLTFKISEPTPAPTILEPVVNGNTSYDKPFIVGLAKNNTSVRVFIDSVFYGKFTVNNDESGTASFAYQPFVALALGTHFVYTTAIDSSGKESIWSNIIYFNVAEPSMPSISDTAAADTNDTVVKGEEADFSKTEQNAELNSKNPVGPSLDAELESLIGTNTNAGEGPTGAINESKEGQSKLNLNLIIFILFLLAVIVWIFWVNRELIKEKQQKDNKNKKENQNKFKL